MKEVLPRIYCLQLPMGDFPPKSVNSYLIKGDNGCLLIDTGWDTEEVNKSFDKQIAQIGVRAGDIKQILLTHSHTDHGAQAGRIRRLSHAPIYLHKSEIPILKARFICADTVCGDRFLKQTDLLLHSYGVPATELEPPQPLLPDVKYLPLPDTALEGGEIVSFEDFNFLVIWTPGHSPGHVCYYEPTQRLLFSGDHVMPNIIPNISLHVQYVSNPLRDYLDSLEVLESLEVSLVLPGHGQPFSDLPQRAKEIVNHHHRLNTDILEVLNNGKIKSAYKIALALPWPTPTGTTAWQNLTMWNRRFTVLEIIAHLEAMRFENKLDRVSRNNITRYHLHS